MSDSEDLRWYLLQNKIHEARICEAFQLFRERGVEPILIKGWAIARLYPENRVRKYTDIDLGVPAADYSLATEILQSDAARKLNIDLHNEFRHLDIVAWGDLFNDSTLTPIGEYPVRILSPEDHLRLLSVHWLTDGGEDREKLYDIHYAVSNRAADFDWVKCLDRAGANRRTWVIAAIGLAHKYTGLSLDGLPFADEALDLPLWLTKRIEKEWKMDTPLRPMHNSLHTWETFISQVKKRLPPNPLFATIQCEAKFDNGTRFPYQVKSFFKRVRPGIARIFRSRAAAAKNANR